jgi:hypothetical protein
MFVRNGSKVGSVLVDEAGTEPKPRKSTAAKKSTAVKKAAPAEPVGEVTSTGSSTGPHLSVKSDEPVSAPKKEASDGDD